MSSGDVLDAAAVGQQRVGVRTAGPPDLCAAIALFGGGGVPAASAVELAGGVRQARRQAHVVRGGGAEFASLVAWVISCV